MQKCQPLPFARSHSIICSLTMSWANFRSDPVTLKARLNASDSKGTGWVPRPTRLNARASALDEAGAELLDAQLAELRAERTFLLATHEPERVERFASARLALAV